MKYIIPYINFVFENTNMLAENEYLFLRFTKDPNRDLLHKKSLWVLYNYDPNSSELNTQNKNIKFYPDLGDGEFAIEHSGLSGHCLDIDYSEPIDIKKILEFIYSNTWYLDPTKDSFSIFVGEFSKNQDTPEGDTFIPRKILYVHKSNNPNDMSL